MEFDNTLVSVIICCYRNYNVLWRAVQSVLYQDYPKIEVYIADDCSDYFNEYSLLKNIEANRNDNIESVTIHRNPVNVGTVRNIKDAVKNIKGSYYITLGADDALYTPTVISDFMSAFKGDPSLWWACGKAAMTSDNLQTIYRYFPEAEDIPYLQERNSEKLFSRWSRKSFVVTPAMCFKKGLMEFAGGYDENYKYLEDWPLFLRLLRQGFTPYYIDTIVLMHSMNGVSNNNGENGIEVRKKFLEEKYLMFKSEVEPYLERLTEEDKKEYYIYKNYWMDRIYFLEILLPNKTFKQKMKLFKEEPRRIKWYLRPRLEKLWNNYSGLMSRWYELILICLLSWITFNLMTNFNISHINPFHVFVICGSYLCGVGVALLFLFYYGIKAFIKCFILYKRYRF